MEENEINSIKNRTYSCKSDNMLNSLSINNSSSIRNKNITINSNLNEEIDKNLVIGNFTKTQSTKNISNIDPMLSEILKDCKHELTLKDKIELVKKEVRDYKFPIVDETKIKKYERIGNGPFGCVFRATYGMLDVALKELEIQLICREDNLKLLLQEINMSLIIFQEHIFDHVPKFHGLFFKDNYICLVFDLVN